MKTTTPLSLVLCIYFGAMVTLPTFGQEPNGERPASLDELRAEVAGAPADASRFDSVTVAVFQAPERWEEILVELLTDFPESARAVVRSVVEGTPEADVTEDVVYTAVRTDPDAMEAIVEGALDAAPGHGEAIAAAATAALRDLAREEGDESGDIVGEERVEADAPAGMTEDEDLVPPTETEESDLDPLTVDTDDGAAGDPVDEIAADAVSIEDGETEEPADEIAADAVTVEDEEMETISVDFPDTEIRTILRSVADLYELNLVVPEELSGRASVRLRDVTWMQVFDIVLSPVGYTYRDDAGIIRIVRDDVVREDVPDDRVIAHDDGTMTVNFENVPIADIVALVATEADLNVVIPQDFMTVGSEATATVRLRNVRWEQVFDVSLSQIGYGYLDRDDIIRIETIERIESVPPATRVVQVKYPSATIIAEFVRELSGVQRVQVDTGTNVLIVTAEEGKMREIERLVERLDQPTEQVMIEAMFIEVSDSDAKDLGVNWESLSGYNLGATDMLHDFNRSRDSDRVSGSSREQSQTITEGPGGVTATSTDSRQRFSEVLRASGTGRQTQALFTAGEFNVVLSALQQRTDARLVSNPTVVTMNAEEARIEVVDHLYREGAANVLGTGQPGDPTRTTFDEPIKLEYLPGITLAVTPTISGGDLINLKARPEINNIVGQQVLGDGPFAQTIPTVRQRFVETNVVVKSGQTLAMSGLADEDSSTTETKVPLLGDMPVVGRFFRSDSRDQDKKNQIIFITATITDPNRHNYTDFVDEHEIMQMGLSHRDIQGSQYQRSDDEERYLRELAAHRAEARQEEIRRMLAEFDEGEDEVERESRTTRTGPRQRR